MTAVNTVTPQTLRAWYRLPQEIAVLDLREEIDFSTGNIFFASCIPLSRIELLIADRVPRLATRIVVVDAPDADVSRAAGRLVELGYTDVHALAGGVEGWRAAGLPVYTGVHVPSKAFAEVIEETLHTPAIDVDELVKRQASGEPLVVVDSRTTDEYRRNTVPGAYGVPGADLLRHIRDLVTDETTPVVVNCGGRTRSIIGAQALINGGLPNPVLSLRGGLLAWRLSGLEPEVGADRVPEELSESALLWGTASAASLAERAGVVAIDEAQLLAFQADASRTTYVLDVRRPQAYEAGHRRGSLPAQGGQLVQETDSYVAVHGSRVVLVDDGDLSQARLTASWLVQLGLRDVFVLKGGLGEGVLETGAHRPAVLGLQIASRARLSPISAPALFDALNDAVGETRVTVIDLDTVAQHKAAHIPGAWRARRTELAQLLPQTDLAERIVLTSEDGVLARIAASQLQSQCQSATARSVTWLDGGIAAWSAAGFELESGLARALGQGETDAWLSPTQRPGDKAAHAQDYLDWELGLPAQVALDPDVRFAPLASERPR